MSETEWIPLGEAARLAGICPGTVRRLIQDGALPTYLRPFDRRTRLVRRDDLIALAEPREALVPERTREADRRMSRPIV